jgi:XTP/dITP diphosphohydrolase
MQMKKVIFATNNAHKLDEVRKITAGLIQLVSLKEIGCNEDIPETSETLEGNALQKARFIHERYGCDCFADDTGLEGESLNNAPGVYSARYAGEAHDAEPNMQKLLRELKGEENRNARFRTVIALIWEGKEYLFDGIIRGTIIDEKKGSAGFGYDPIFMPEDYDKTFAELGDDIKNKISHRALAVKQLAEFLSATTNKI